jgi:hypothetical protein
MIELTWKLSGRWYAGIVAGVAYALYPPALFLVHSGMSEPIGAFLVIAALLAIASERFHLTALLFGLAYLVRPNLVLLPICIATLAFLRPFRFSISRRQIVTNLIIFFIPMICWTARNYIVTGHFPVVTTLGGITLYGSNNAVVAGTLDHWGYWLVPDRIPGETARRELAARMSAYEVDRYYTSRAILYLKSSWFSLPRLILGKLIRAHVPIPWKPSLPGYAAALCRLCLYAAVLLTIRRWVHRAGRNYLIGVASLFLVNLITCLVFYGTARFTFLLEVGVLPVAVIGLFETLSSYWNGRRTEHNDLSTRGTEPSTIAVVHTRASVC